MMMATRNINEINEKFGGIAEIMRQLNEIKDEEKEALFGKNEMAKPKTKSFLRIWLESFKDFILILLICLAVVSLIISFVFERDEKLSWMDGVTILGTVVAVTRLFKKDYIF
jgi:Ca2+-transporting ATPase